MGRQFVGIDLGPEPVPDETTACKFRHLLEEHGPGGKILETANLYLQSKGVKITTGTIVDAGLQMGGERRGDEITANFAHDIVNPKIGEVLPYR